MWTQLWPVLAIIKIFLGILIIENKFNHGLDSIFFGIILIYVYLLELKLKEYESF